jgi:outer membrane immunogenic protein
MTMKIGMAATAALVLGWLGWTFPAHTADLYGKAPPQSVVSFSPWAGFYGGLSVGYGLNWSGLDINDGTTLATLGNAPHGYTGGARLGYDYQSGPFVIGLVTDASLAGFNSDSNMTGLSISNATNWWGSVNGRVGLTSLGSHWLPYAIGGLAYGGNKTAFSAANLAGAASKTSTGWNAGGGIEVKLGNSPVSLFGEYRYIDLGSLDIPIAAGVLGTEKYTFSVFQVGANLRF